MALTARQKLAKAKEGKGKLANVFDEDKDILTATLPKIPKANCEECPLKYNAFIPGDPTPFNNKKPLSHKDYFWLGMHAGKEEAEKGEVFCGPSGDLLRQTIPQIDMTDSAFFNAVQCVPAYKTNGDLDSEQNEIARQCCAPAIHEIIKSYSPKLVIGMGPEGLKTAGVELPTGEGIIKNHGIITKSKITGIDTLASIHPAYVIRQSDSFVTWYEGIYYAKKFWENPPKLPKVKVLRSVKEITELLNRVPRLSLEPNTLVSLDIETEGLKLFRKILCIQISWDGEIGYVIPWPWDISVEWNEEFQEWIPNVPEKDAEFYRVIKNFLESSEYSFILQNANYDATYLAGYDIIIEIKYDTLIESQLVNENAFSHGLKERSRTMLGYPDWDEPLKQYMPKAQNKTAQEEFSWAEIPSEELYLYAGWDPVATGNTHKAYVADMDEEDINVRDTISMPTLNLFTKIRIQGIKIDVPRAFVTYDFFINKADQIARDIIIPLGLELGLGLVKPNSALDMAELLYDGLKIRPPNLREPRSTNKKILDRMPLLPIVTAIKEYREAVHDASQLSSVCNLYDDGKIHPQFTFVKTGRLAARDPSVFNIKKGSPIRKAFVARNEDYVLVEADQAQFELRFFTALTNAEKMKEAFIQGIDVHYYFTKLMNPNLPEEVLREPKRRTITKNGVFGALYWAGVQVTAETLLPFAFDDLKANDIERFNIIAGSSKDAIPEYNIFFAEVKQQAKRVLEQFEELCPEVIEYREQIVHEINTTGQIVTITGRKRRLPLVTEESRKHMMNQGVNTPIQGPANDINLINFREVAEHFDDGRNKAFPWLTIHDSEIFEVHKAHIPEVIHFIKECMESGPGRILGHKEPEFTKMPFKVEFEVGENWGEMKKIKEDDNGKLLIPSFN